jgi:hypothetical protein
VTGSGYADTVGCVQAWQALLWGLFGGAAIEGLDLTTAIRRCGGSWPWKRKGEVQRGPYLLSVLIRIGVSGGVAAAAANSSQISTVFAAVTTGVAAPLILENVAKSAVQASQSGQDASTPTAKTAAAEPTISSTSAPRASTTRTRSGGTASRGTRQLSAGSGQQEVKPESVAADRRQQRGKESPALSPEVVGSLDDFSEADVREFVEKEKVGDGDVG